MKFFFKLTFYVIILFVFSSGIIFIGHYFYPEKFESSKENITFAMDKIYASVIYLGDLKASILEMTDSEESVFNKWYAYVESIEIPDVFSIFDGDTPSRDLEILNTDPLSYEKNWRIDSEMEIVFDCSVRLEDFSKQFYIYPSNDIQEGSFPENDGFFNGEFYYLIDENGNEKKSVIRIKSNPPLAYDQEYKLVIENGLSCESENRGLRSDYEVVFYTESESY